MLRAPSHFALPHFATQPLNFLLFFGWWWCGYCPLIQNRISEIVAINDASTGLNILLVASFHRHQYNLVYMLDFKKPDYLTL